jgi:hypothetical protein
LTNLLLKPGLFLAFLLLESFKIIKYVIQVTLKALMFGNPLDNFSNADVYSSQADTYGNSFQNPMNVGNMNPGWGMDPNLMTPSYSSSYRPQYSGSNGSEQHGNRGFAKGIWDLSPVATDVMWGNPFMHTNQSLEDVSSRPADATMWGFQRIMAPSLMYMGGRALSSKLGLGWGMGSRFGAGLGGGMASAFGMKAPSGGSGLRATMSGIRGAYSAGGASAAFTAARAVGFGGAANLAARGAMGSAVGAAAWGAVPIGIAMAGMYGVEKGITDPYINTRRSARDLRDNFSGITFSDAQGDAVTGGGLGFKESYGIAQKLTSQGIKDMTFSNGEYRQGADMIGRSGLLDGTNSKGISKAIKDSMDQVKLIMSIAKMPEIKEAIEELAKLNMAGASFKGGLNSTAADTIRQMGGYASAAGVSVSKLMSEVGAQGQYLYQANGMTPYLGQMAAGGAYSAFETGKRMGLVSTAQLARMGGPEGATQASLTGQINGSQTMYNQMALYNSFMGGGKGGSAYGPGQNTVDVVSKFGQSMSGNPLETYGGMMMFGRQMAGKQMEERGSLAIQDQLMSIAKYIPNAINKETGMISSQAAFPLLMQMGMDRDQAQAYLSQRSIESDAGGLSSRLKSFDKFRIEQETQHVTQQGLYGGLIGGSYYEARKTGREITDKVQRSIVNPITNVIGSVADSARSFSDDLIYGNSLIRKETEAQKNAYLGKSSETEVAGTSYGVLENETIWREGQHRELVKAINIASKSGNAQAREATSTNDPTRRMDLVRGMLKSGALSKDITEEYIGGGLEKSLNKMAEATAYLSGLSTSTKNPDKVSKSRGMYDGIDFGGRIGSIDTLSNFTKKTDPTLNSDLSLITGNSNLSNTDRLKILSAADVVTNKLAAYDKDPKTGLNRFSSNEDILKDEDVQRFARYKGIKTNNSAEILKQAGLTTKYGSDKALTRLADKVSNSDGTWTDLSAKAQYDSAVTNGDKAGQDAALLKEGISKNDGKVRSGSNLDGKTVEEKLDFESIGKGLDKQRAHIQRLVSENKIDNTNANSATAAIDMSKAVNDFGKWVDKLKTKDGNPAPSTERAWYDPRIFRKDDSSDNTRTPSNSPGNPSK